MAQTSISVVQYVNDGNVSAISDENEDDMYLNPDFKYAEELQLKEALTASDSKYAEELQLQEALAASLIVASDLSNNGVSLQIQSYKFPKPEPFSSFEFPAKVGESSHRICEICADKKDPDEMFTIGTCSHSFCSDCVTKHVVVKIEERAVVVGCPGLKCSGVLEIEACRSIVPADVAATWEEVLCESMIPASQKFYCPFKDCSAVMVNDEEEGIRESECGECHRLFCAACKVPWHAGIVCEEFEKLNEDERGREDLMVRELARRQSWMRCPQCKYYVEKREGCLHMTCRCKFQFCYACGETWSNTHGDCRPRPGTNPITRV